MGDKLSLFAYRVASMTTETGTSTATTAQAQPEAPASTSEQVVAGTRDGARREILDAARAVVARSGGALFTMPEVIAEMNRRGTTYAERTIRTMIGATCAPRPSETASPATPT